MASKKNNRKQHILEAAAQLFREKGYSATSMRDLAKAVDLKASSLYNHISGKEEILRDICFNNAKRFLEALRQVESGTSNPAGKVRALIRLHIQVATEDITSIMALNDEWRHLSEPHLSEFIAMRKEYELRFKAIIEQGIREGSFKAYDANIALYTIFSAMRWIYDWYRPGRSISIEQLEEEVAGLLLTGLNNNYSFEIS
ncbi:MAG: TetR/AcrR family transcriptional regulator [Saprospiraceae bacterium]